MLQEFSIFVEDNFSELERLLRLIGESKIDIKSWCLVEAGNYSILRIIFDKNLLCEEILTQNNFTFNINKVLAILVEDKPGELYKIISLFVNSGISIKYAYQIQSKFIRHNCLIVNAKDVENSEKLIKNNKSIKLLNIEDI